MKQQIDLFVMYVQREEIQYFHFWLMNVASVRGGKYKVTHLLSYKCGVFFL